MDVLMMKLLLALLGTLAAVAILAIGASMQVRATREECGRALGGDNLIPQPIDSVNHAITIRRLLATSGRGWLRWAPIGPAGTPTTSLTTVAITAPNASCPTIKISAWEAYPLRFPELGMYFLSHSVSSSTA